MDKDTKLALLFYRSLSPQVPHTYHNPTLMASPYSTLPRRPTSSSSGASSANRGQPQQPHGTAKSVFEFHKNCKLNPK